MDGVINVYKEKGYTSHDVVAVVKKILGVKKVGHAGTLDPEAQGVLIVLLGKATKLSDYLMAGEKEYRAGVKFGVATTTYDHTGEITDVGQVNFTEEELNAAVAGFIGEQMQLPPMYAAIKLNGVKLYDLARKGIEAEREARKITVYDIYTERFNGYDEAIIYIRCGKGSYVRSICHDLGRALGCGAHMTSLTRTRSGTFRIDGAYKLSEIQESIGEALIPLDKVLERFNKITVSNRANKLLYNGAKIGHEYLLDTEKTEDLNVLYDEKGMLVGIYQNENGFMRPRTMLL